MLIEGPIDRSSQKSSHVNWMKKAAALESLRTSVNAGAVWGGDEVAWIGENRLTRVLRDTNDQGKGYFASGQTQPEIGVLAAYTYDALGRRVETKEYVNVATGEYGGTATQPVAHFVTRHVYTGLENIQDWSWRGDVSTPGYYVKQQYLWGDSARFPEPMAMLTPFEAQTPEGEPIQVEKSWHYLHDMLGSVVGVVDDNGTLVERYTYDPYGKVFIVKWGNQRTPYQDPIGGPPLPQFAGR